MILLTQTEKRIRAAVGCLCALRDTDLVDLSRIVREDPPEQQPVAREILKALSDCRKKIIIAQAKARHDFT